MFKKLKGNKKGFTLAELLIVVAIIAILTAIAIPAFSAARDDAEAKVHESNSRAIHSEATIRYLGDKKLTSAVGDYGETGGSGAVTYTWKVTEVTDGKDYAIVTHTGCNNTKCKAAKVSDVEYSYQYFIDSNLATPSGG